ncbi:hypothetical protein LCGC14_2858000 [marine sediment metagenome]|uniref:Uncharacterized protein n=1 Tax=marine sediment metagenome TaxID=412755 RepID=A0A0F9AXF9_9ZZZZ
MAKKSKKTAKKKASKKKKAETAGPGRKTAYRPEFIERAARYCSQHGYTDEKLGEEFGVTDRTIRDWKKKYPGFAKGVEEGKGLYKTDLNFLARKNLKKSITGYEVLETTREPSKKRGKQAVMVITKTVRRKIGPNVSAARLQLERCDPDYQPKAKIDVGDGTLQLNITVGKYGDSGVPPETE